MNHQDHHRAAVSPAIKRLRKMSDARLRALTDDEFWDAIEPDGICPGCDPRLAAEARRRSGKTLSEQGEPTKQ
jgi:hypothetical protein